jgi:hypothetical protein
VCVRERERCDVKAALDAPLAASTVMQLDSAPGICNTEVN